MSHKIMLCFFSYSALILCKLKCDERDLTHFCLPLRKQTSDQSEHNKCVSLSATFAPIFGSRNIAMIMSSSDGKSEEEIADSSKNSDIAEEKAVSSESNDSDAESKSEIFTKQRSVFLTCVDETPSESSSSTEAENAYKEKFEVSLKTNDSDSASESDPARTSYSESKNDSESNSYHSKNGSLHIKVAERTFFSPRDHGSLSSEK